jgi:hypothetical protein
MSQSAFLRALAADMTAQFLDAGMADSATYQAPDSATLVPCTVLFDSPEMTQIGNDGPNTGMLNEITLLYAEVPDPRRGGRVIIDGIAWRLDQLQHENEAVQTRWAVIRDRP